MGGLLWRLILQAVRDTPLLIMVAAAAGVAEVVAVRVVVEQAEPGEMVSQV